MYSKCLFYRSIYIIFARGFSEVFLDVKGTSWYTINRDTTKEI